MLGKKFIGSMLASGNADPVNLDLTYTFVKSNGADYSGSRPGSGPVFEIHFHQDQGGTGPGIIVWKYDTEENRDIEYNLLLENYVHEVEKSKT